MHSFAACVSPCLSPLWSISRGRDSRRCSYRCSNGNTSHGCDPAGAESLEHERRNVTLRTVGAGHRGDRTFERGRRERRVIAGGTLRKGSKPALARIWRFSCPTRAQMAWLLRYRHHGQPFKQDRSTTTSHDLRRGRRKRCGRVGEIGPGRPGNHRSRCFAHLETETCRIGPVAFPRRATV